VDSTASSTGEIIHRLLKKMGFAITGDIATNIYTAILTDTGSFRYSNTGSDTFRVAADLVDKGANSRCIAERIYETRPANQVRLMAKVLDTLEFYEGERWVSFMSRRRCFAGKARYRSTQKALWI